MAPRVVKEADERRAELLDTAMSLFAARGYGNVPVQTITEEVGVAKGTFYHYFSSKDELLDALIERQSDLLVAEAQRRLDGCGGGAVAMLRAVIDTFAGWKMENWDVVYAAMKTMYADANSALRQRYLDQDLDELRLMLAAVIAEGHEEGSFDVAEPGDAAEAVLWLWRGMSQPLAAALLACDGAEGAELAVAKLHTSETAIERILGARPGSLDLYDYGTVRAALAAGPGAAP
jgi:AcrR family transcriptional regulator